MTWTNARIIYERDQARGRPLDGWQQEFRNFCEACGLPLTCVKKDRTSTTVLCRDCERSAPKIDHNTRRAERDRTRGDHIDADTFLGYCNVCDRPIACHEQWIARNRGLRCDGCARRSGNAGKFNHPAPHKDNADPGFENVVKAMEDG